jgi:hypothetical protein
MKRFPLLLPLVAVVVAAACMDSTSPPNSHALLSAKNPNLGFLGDPPPPPVDAAINITISSISFSGAFNGVYFANGTSLESGVAAQDIGDESLTFTGTAWLRLNNVQPDFLGTSASANARFQRTDLKLFGMGTLMIQGHTVRIDKVTSFLANPSCGATGELCAVIEFDATVDGVSGHHGHVEAFNIVGCSFDGIYFCSPIEIG